MKFDNDFLKSLVFWWLLGSVIGAVIGIIVRIILDAA